MSDAMGKRMQANARKIVGKFLANKSSNLQAKREDLVKAAEAEAARKWQDYDPNHESKADFITYAQPFMLGVVKAEANKNLVHDPIRNSRYRYVRNNLGKVMDEHPEIEKSDYAALAEALNEHRLNNPAVFQTTKDAEAKKGQKYTAEDVKEELLRREMMNVSSLDAPLRGDEDGATGLDMLADENASVDEDVSADEDEATDDDDSVDEDDLADENDRSPEALEERARQESARDSMLKLLTPKLLKSVLEPQELAILRNDYQLKKPKPDAELAKALEVSEEKVGELRESMKEKIRAYLDEAMRGDDSTLFNKVYQEAGKPGSYKDLIAGANSLLEKLKAMVTPKTRVADNRPVGLQIKKEADDLIEKLTKESPGQAHSFEVMRENIQELLNYMEDLAVDLPLQGPFSAEFKREILGRVEKAIFDQIFLRPDTAEDLAAYDPDAFRTELASELEDEFNTPRSVANLNAYFIEKMLSRLAGTRNIIPSRIWESLELQTLSEEDIRRNVAGFFRSREITIGLTEDPQLQLRVPLTAIHEVMHLYQWALLHYGRNEMASLAPDFEIMAREAGIAPDQDIYQEEVWRTSSESEANTHKGKSEYYRKPTENAAFQFESFLSEYVSNNPDTARVMAPVRDLLDDQVLAYYFNGVPEPTEPMVRVFNHILGEDFFPNLNPDAQLLLAEEEADEFSQGEVQAQDDTESSRRNLLGLPNQRSPIINSRLPRTPGSGSQVLSSVSTTGQGRSGEAVGQGSSRRTGEMAVRDARGRRSVSRPLSQGSEFARRIYEQELSSSQQRDLDRLSQDGASPETLAEARDITERSSEESGAAARKQLADRDPDILANRAPVGATADNAMDAAVQDTLTQSIARLANPSENPEPTTDETHLDDPQELDAPVPLLPDADFRRLNELLNEEPPASSRPSIPREASSAPVPTANQLALAALQASRREAASQAPGPDNGMAPAPINPKKELDKWRARGIYLRSKLEDSGARFRSWAAWVQNVGDGNPEDTPFHRALTLKPAEARQAFARIAEKRLMPIVEWLERKSRASGLDMTTLFERAGMVATVRHVLDEGAAVYRQGLVDEVDEARANHDQDPSDDNQAALLEAQSTLDTYDEYQRAMDEGKEWDRPMPRVAGGVSTAARRAQRAELRNTFTEAEFEEISNLISEAFEGLTLERLRAGTLTTEDLAGWADFLHYVPLSTKVQVNQLAGNQMAGWIFNPSRADYRRNGSTTPADHALNILWKAADRTALEIGNQPFTQELNKLHGVLDAAGNTHGLLKIATDQINRMIASPNPMTRERGLWLRETPGYIYREKYKDKNGQARTRSFKITFDQGQTEQEQADYAQLRKSMAEVQSQSSILENMGKVTRFHGLLNTKLRPAFAALNLPRDFGERLFNVFSHADFYREDGTKVSGTEVAAGMFKAMWEGSGAYLDAQFRGKGNDSHYGRLWEEFRQSGANYTVLNMVQGLRKESQRAVPPVVRNAILKHIKQLPGAREAGKLYQKVNDIINKYNDVFNSYPAFLQYAALRDLKVSPKDAAAYTLDMMNYYKRGEWEPVGSAFWPFFRATVQGGANMVRALSPYNKNKATKFRGALTGIGLTIAATVLISWLRELAGDDDETGLNRWDQIPFSQAVTAIHLPFGDGSYIKIPLPFGGPQWFWLIGLAVDRVRRDQMDPGEGAFRTMMGFAKQVVPDAYPDYSPAEHPLSWALQTFAPQPVRPFVDIAVNKNYWGGQINYGNNTPGMLEYEKGRKSTPTKWHFMAKWLHDVTGTNLATPEDLRHVFNGYLAGPLQGMTSYIESDKLNQPMHASTRDRLGPFLTAIGASMGWSAGQNVAQSYYFQEKREIERELTRLGVSTTHPDNTSHEQKLARVRRGMREAGMEQEVISKYLAILGIDKDLDKLDRDLRKNFNKLKFSEMDEEFMKKDFERWNRDRQYILERAARTLHRYDRR
jgi:hypothetical protein